jgi:enamine deaminase RidA (YjgF/YER057c/UK114 family)
MSSDSAVPLLRSERLSPGVPYAYAASTDAPPRLVFTAGAFPLEAEGRTVAVGDVAGQAEQVMANCAPPCRSPALI